MPTASSFQDNKNSQYQQSKDQYLKYIETQMANWRENGLSGTFGQVADALSSAINNAVAGAKQIPDIVNKQTEVALDRTENGINQVASLPLGERILQSFSAHQR